MSVDEKVSRSLIETLQNGQVGFLRASERLEEHGRHDLAHEFASFSKERATLADQLAAMAGEYGDEIQERSTLPGAAHRGWMAIKDLFSGHDVDGVLKASLQGEDHAVSDYESALGEDISDGLRDLVTRQSAEVTATRDRVKSLVAK